MNRRARGTPRRKTPERAAKRRKIEVEEEEEEDDDEENAFTQSSSDEDNSGDDEDSFGEYRSTRITRSRAAAISRQDQFSPRTRTSTRTRKAAATTTAQTSSDESSHEESSSEAGPRRRRSSGRLRRKSGSSSSQPARMREKSTRKVEKKDYSEEEDEEKEKTEDEEEKEKKEEKEEKEEKEKEAEKEEAEEKEIENEEEKEAKEKEEKEDKEDDEKENEDKNEEKEKVTPRRRGRPRKQSNVSETHANKLDETPAESVKRTRKRKRDSLEASFEESLDSKSESKVTATENISSLEPLAPRRSLRRIQMESLKEAKLMASSQEEAPASPERPKTPEISKFYSAVRDAAVFNVRLLVDRHRCGPFYFDPHTKTHQVLYSYVIKDPVDPTPPAGYTVPEQLASMPRLDQQLEKLAWELELQKDAVNEIITYSPWTEQLLTLYKCNLDEAKARGFFPALAVANTKAKRRLKAELDQRNKKQYTKPGPKPRNVCVECNNELPEKRKTAFVYCATCNTCRHSGCLGLPSKTVKRIRTYAWRCNNCKVCEVCHESGDEERLLLCEACDRGYHTYCLRPPVSQLPAGEWVCKDCSISREAQSKRKRFDSDYDDDDDMYIDDW